MADQNFTPTGQPQNLPGMDVPTENTQGSVPSNGYNAEKVVNVPPSTTPPRVKIEYPAPDEDQKNHRATIGYGIAVVFLIIVLIFGVMLIVWTVPKIVGSLSNFGKLPAPSTNSNVATTTPVSANTSNTTATSTTISTKPVAISNSADLRVRILAVNRIGDDISVRFDVRNIGGRTSGTWSFNVILPSSTVPIYYSVPQQGIAPQSGIINTLTFPLSPSANNQIGIKIFATSGETDANNNVAYYVLY